MSAEHDLVPQVGVAVFSRDGRLLLHTPRFGELLAGNGAAIAVGSGLADILTSLADSDCPGSCGPPPASLHRVTADGRAIDIAFETLPHGRCCMTVTDVTQAHAARDDLRRARSAAEAASRAKSAFLATMSHELRTPLNAVLGFSEALRQDGEEAGAHPLDPARIVEFAGAIHEAGQHLLERINTVLDVARIESGRFDLASDLIDLDYMLHFCVRQVRPAALAGHVTLVTEIAPQLPRLRADERRLRQVIGQLLGNAVKFTPAGGTVAVVASCPAGRDGDGPLEIAVRDTGIGIAADDIERVFEPFSQLDTSHARRRTGAGLGLYAARCLIAAHGGSLTLDSLTGQGTTATVRLPRGRLVQLPSPLELTQDPT